MGLSPGGSLVFFGLALFIYAAKSALTCKLTRGLNERNLQIDIMQNVGLQSACLLLQIEICSNLHSKSLRRCR